MYPFMYPQYGPYLAPYWYYYYYFYNRNREFDNFYGAFEDESIPADILTEEEMERIGEGDITPRQFHSVLGYVEYPMEEGAFESAE